jgi:hypothetical protein
MTDHQLQQARSLLTDYADTPPHHAFQTARQYYEGYILEVRNETILFCWAPSPFDESDDPKEPFEIAIESIEMASLGKPKEQRK